MTFDNRTATDRQRVEFLTERMAAVENHGDDTDPEWLLFYGHGAGQREAQLDAQNYKDAIYEACELLKD